MSASAWRKVAASTWSDARFLALSDDAKLLWFFFLTGPLTTNLPGVIVTGRQGLAEAIGWSPRKLGKALEELERNDGSTTQPMLVADWKSRIVYLPAALRYNVPTNPSQVDGWSSQWTRVVECALKDRIVVEFGRFIAPLHPNIRSSYEKLTKSALPTATPSAVPPVGSSDSGVSNSPDSLACARPAPAPAPAPSSLPASLGGDLGSISQVTAREAPNPVEPEPDPEPEFPPGMRPIPRSESILSVGAGSQRAIEVFTQALIDARGEGYVLVKPAVAAGVLVAIVNAYCRGRGPTQTTNGALAELDRLTRAWVEAKSGDEERFTGGWKPELLAAWLNASGAAEDADDDEIPPYEGHAAESAVVVTPEEQERRRKQQEVYRATMKATGKINAQVDDAEAS